MKHTKATTELICKIENIIASECYNYRSTDGRTGQIGKWFRYPVHYTDKDGIECKTSWTIGDMDKKDIDTMFYHFGSNQLFIGNAIVNVLEYLEKTYNIDFNELTKKK